MCGKSKIAMPPVPQVHWLCIECMIGPLVSNLPLGRGVSAAQARWFLPQPGNLQENLPVYAWKRVWPAVVQMDIKQLKRAYRKAKDHKGQDTNRQHAHSTMSLTRPFGTSTLESTGMPCWCKWHGNEVWAVVCMVGEWVPIWGSHWKPDC